MNKFKKVKNEIDNQIASTYQKYLKDDLVSNNNLNEATIVLHLEDEEYYKDFSNQSLLKQEIFDYLDNSFGLIDKKKNMKLKVIFKDTTSTFEKEKVLNLIKTHYALEYKNNHKDIVRTRIIALISFIAGLVMFGIYTIFVHYNLNEILQEIIDIFAWVFIWETCDLLAFGVNSYRVKSIKNYKLFKMEIME